MKLAIGLATYKRPIMLERCVHSLQKMNTASDIEMCIIIADNDANGTAKRIVEELRKNTKYTIYYQVEKGRGIPFARNNILKQALELDIDYLAFIDDDEWVNENWLRAHWNYMKKSDADVTYGSVKTIYPHHTPNWIIKGQFYQRNKEMTGKLLNVAYTNNVIFDFKKLVNNWNVYFEESFGLRGGSDADYFYRAVNKGAVIRNVRHAEVNEELEDDRMSVVYVLKRKWRTRNNKELLKNMNKKIKLAIFMGSIFFIFLFPPIFIINLFRGKDKYVKILMRITEAIAIILGFFGIFIQWNEYKK